jgi:hypothetical protein
MMKKIIIVLLVLFMIGCSAPPGRDYIGEVNDQIKVCYQEKYDEFNDEYKTRYGVNYNTAAKIQEGITAFESLKVEFEEVNTCFVDLSNLAAEGASSYEGDQNIWIDNIGKCYAKRTENAESMRDVLDNYITFINYKEKEVIIIIQHDAFDSARKEYNKIIIEKDAKKAADASQKVVDELEKLKTRAIEAKEVLPVEGFENFIKYCELRAEEFSFRKQAWQSTGSESKDFDRNAEAKEREALKLMIFDDLYEDIDNWFKENIMANDILYFDTHKEVDDGFCKEASKVVDSVF